MPGGPRGLQNRRRYASGEVGSIPILSASSFLIADCRFAICDLRFAICDLRFAIALAHGEQFLIANRNSKIKNSLKGGEPHVA